MWELSTINPAKVSVSYDSFGYIFGLYFDLAFWIICTKCMQNTNGLNMCYTGLLKVYRHFGPNPSGLGDLRQCWKFKGQTQLKFESLKSENINFRESGPTNSNELFSSLKATVLPFPDLNFEWCNRHRLWVLAILISLRLRVRRRLLGITSKPVRQKLTTGKFNAMLIIWRKSE